MAKKQDIKSRQFEIPEDFIGTFFTELDQSGLSSNVLEWDDDNEELLVEIFYSHEQREIVMDLIEVLDDYLAEMQEEESEEEDDE